MLSIIGPSGHPLIAGAGHIHGTVAESGWHLVRVSANAAAGAADYKLSVTYSRTESVSTGLGPIGQSGPLP
jgi:hypothetical protein